MLTRRQVLAGTAAGSIAAIASARGVAAATDAQGFDVGFGSLLDGAAVVFHKQDLGFSFFLKLQDSAAHVFYKEEILGQIGVFLKYYPTRSALSDAAFQKVTWNQVDQFEGFLKNTVGAEAGFYKVQATLAQIFLKFQGPDQTLLQDVRTLEGGILSPSENVCGVQIE